MGQARYDLLGKSRFHDIVPDLQKALLPYLNVAFYCTRMYLYSAYHNHILHETSLRLSNHSWHRYLLEPETYRQHGTNSVAVVPMRESMS